MRFYVICGSILFVVGLITTNFVYVIKSERKIKDLQQENVVLKTNEEQAKIEVENNKKIIIELNNKINKQNNIEKKKHKEIAKDDVKIQNLSIKEQGNLINSIFVNL